MRKQQKDKHEIETIREEEIQEAMGQLHNIQKIYKLDSVVHIIGSC